MNAHVKMISRPKDLPVCAQKVYKSVPPCVEAFLDFIELVYRVDPRDWKVIQ